MLLSDTDIKKALQTKKIVIKPAPDFTTALSPCSVDLTLSTEFKVFEYTKLFYVDTKKKLADDLLECSTREAALFCLSNSLGHVNTTLLIKVKRDDPFILQPGEFALGATFEWIKLPDDIAGRLEGRSSLGRLGIVIHSTAALIHPGFNGNIVLELGNHSRMPVALYPHMRICALSFEKLTTPAAVPYNKQKDSKYLNQKGVVGSLIDKE